MGKSNRDGAATTMILAVETADAFHIGSIGDGAAIYIQGEQNWATNFVYPQETERSEEHTSELQSLMRISYAVFCLKKKTKEKHKKLIDIQRHNRTNNKQ